MYCLTGVRSDAVVKLLSQKGFTNVYDLKSGLKALKLTAKPVQGSAKVKQIPFAEYNA